MKRLILLSLCAAYLFAETALAAAGYYNLTIQNNTSQTIKLENGPGAKCMDSGYLAKWNNQLLPSNKSTAITLAGDTNNCPDGQTSLVNVRMANSSEYAQCSLNLYYNPDSGNGYLTCSGCANGSTLNVTCDINNVTITITE